MDRIKFMAGWTIRHLRLNGRQRSLAANTLSNLAIVPIGFSMTNQPLASIPMTGYLRGSMIGFGAVLFGIALWLERGHGRRSND